MAIEIVALSDTIYEKCAVKICMTFTFTTGQDQM